MICIGVGRVNRDRVSTSLPNYNSVHKYTDQRIAADAARPVSVSGSVPISIVSLFTYFYLGRDFPVPVVGLQVGAAYPVGHIS